MLRIVVETCDAGIPAHVGGSVDRYVKTFYIAAPELEAYLREFCDRDKAGQVYWHRRAIGVEVLPNRAIDTTAYQTNNSQPGAGGDGK